MAERNVSTSSGPFQPASGSDRIWEIERLRQELDLLNWLIEEANRSKEEDYARIDPGKMREVANLIEGVLDEYNQMTIKQKSYLEKAVVLIEKLRGRDNLGRNIRNINALLTQIWLNGIPERRSTAVVKRRYHTNMELIGAPKDNAEDLMNNFLLGRELGRSAIAVLGTGGIGKTTLATWIYNTVAVVEHFEIRVWITISHGCISALKILTPTQVLKFQRVTKELEKSVMESLKGKRYLIVFDDILTRNLWYVVRDSLPDDGLGSRVIVTTRNAAVADSSEFVRVHRVERLTFDDSWELFCKIAFRIDPERRCPEELRPASVKIVGICNGLPLTIKVVAGLLSVKPKVAEEWGTVLCNLEQRLLMLQLDVHEFVSLAFNDLPLHLKRCIVHLNVFTEQPAMIDSEKLIRLWIAEGFVQKTREKTSEEVADEYLWELVERCMVEACEGFFCFHEVIQSVVRRKATNRDYWLSFSYSDGNRDTASAESFRREIINQSSFKSDMLSLFSGDIEESFRWEIINQSSFKSDMPSLFSDDIED